MSTDDRVSALERLQADMEADDRISDDLFFFPEYNSVKGYYGTGPVWFIGPKPSTGTFPSRADELLYDTLEEFGFQNAHITDVSKERGSVPEQGIPHEELARMRPYFQRELEILQPEVLGAMSRNVQLGLKYMAATDGIEIEYVHHYSWAAGRGDREVFIDDIRSLARKYLK